MAKPHRIAIIGIGAIAGMHARAIGDLDNATLVAGSCRSADKGAKFAEQFGCNWYENYEAMLDAEKPDVATIATPSGAHLDAALARFARGVHVLCEKPLEITTQRIDRMIDAAKRAGVMLGGIFPQRFNPVVRAIHAAAHVGRFGNLAVVNSYVPWWRDDAYYAPGRWQGTLALDGGGAMMNQSIHGVDLVQWLAAATAPSGGAGGDSGAARGATGGASTATANPVAEIFAFTARRGHDETLIEVEDTAVAVLRFYRRSAGQILGATSMYPGSLKRLQIAGRDGAAEILEDQLITWRFREDADGDDDVRARFGASTSHGGGAADPMAIDSVNHTRNLAAFLDALEDRTPLMLDGAEARKAVAIIEAAYASARTGAPVKPG